MLSTVNRNVRTFYFYTAALSLGRGIWMGNILSLYIVVLAEAMSGGVLGLSPNELLGVTSAATGVAMLVTVVPAGLLADRWSSRGTLLIGAAVGAVGLGFLALGAGLASIVLGLFLWGVFQGFTRPSAEAMLANSTRSGDRSLVYSRAHLIEQIGSGAGPFLNVALFLVLGDQWDLEILRVVMNVGLGVSLASAAIVVGLRERDTLGSESEAIGYGEPVVGQAAAAAGGSCDSAPGSDYATTPRVASPESARRWIPYAFLASSFIIGSGAGMTVKFFPVFFRTIYAFQPIAVQLVMGAGLFATALATFAAQQMSRRRGRGEMIVVLQGVAIACLFGMATYPAPALVVLLFVLRGAFMNATTPLSRTIVMDYVPRRNRGVWSSLQTVAWGLFWNASALIGGFLVGDDNFRRAFIVTGFVYVVGTAIIVPFVPHIHREVDRPGAAGTAEGGESGPPARSASSPVPATRVSRPT